MGMLRFFSPLHRQLEPELQSIEVWAATAIPSFRVVGLPGPEIIESCERVRASIEASGLEFPRKRILVNLSPAGVRKQGTGTDLAIALAVMSLQRSENKSAHPLRRIVASGELALDGNVRSAGRVLRTLVASMTLKADDLVLAEEDRVLIQQALHLIQETPRFSDRSPPRIHLVKTLSDAFDSLRSKQSAMPPLQAEFPVYNPPERELLTLSSELERSLLASAAGAHHLLLIGPKGTGKTAALEWLHLLQAQLSSEDLLDRIMLDELSRAADTSFHRTAPVRIVPPQIRPEALIGGFSRGELRPGEFSRAHGGTLIADEFPEWPRDSRETLRDPMETGIVHVMRSQQSFRLPSRFQFAASANLCRCGGWPRSWTKLRDPTGQSHASLCKCSDQSRIEYLARLSGPILDRIDIVKPVFGTGIRPDHNSRSQRPEEVCAITNRCRSLLIQQWNKVPGRLPPAELEAIVRAEPAIEENWRRWGRAPEGSLRRRHKEIRVALTLAALDQILGNESGPIPSRRHFEEARAASAEAWLHSLCQTPIRYGRPMSKKTSIDRTCENP